MFPASALRQLTKYEMKKMEGAYYQPGAAIAFETEKTMFLYLSKEFTVRSTGDGVQVPCRIDLENAFPEQFFIGFTTRMEFSDQVPEATLSKWDSGKTMLGMERFEFKRCGITKIDIKLGDVSIFDDGPIE